MPALLSSRVFLLPQTGKFPTETALLELNADNTIRLTRVDPQGGGRKDIVFDDAINDIQIGGAGTGLTFTTNGNTWRVEFSPYNAGQRVITVDQANQDIFLPATASTWAAKLRELGYPTRYRSAQNVRVVAIVLAVVVVVIVVIIVLSNLSRPIFS
jgi:hypothetical protein